jgi:hypothetical protein
MLGRRTIIACAAFALLAGCGGSGVQAPPLLDAAGATRSGNAQSHPWLYVSDPSRDVVDAYDLGVSGNPKVRTIHSGVRVPQALSVDNEGTLYVANDNGTLTEYPEGAVTPALTLSVSEAVGVAVDHNLDLYVISREPPATLFVYHQHARKPYQSITSPFFQVPMQLLFDAADNLYIADNNAGVLLMPAGTTAPKPVPLQGLGSCPSGLALDNENGHLFVSSCGGGTQSYVAGRDKLRKTFATSIASDNLALGAYQGSNVVFLPSLEGGEVSIYNESGTQVGTLSTGFFSSEGIAYKRAGI